jgi:HKD family nuclease
MRSVPNHPLRVKITILNPNDQPTGNWRLLYALRECLNSPDFDTLRIAVAFAKTGPLYRLKAEIEAWRGRKNQIHAIFGINHCGTSRQALEFAIEHFSATRILYFGERLTFHPKMYIFTGKQRCRFFIGSHNLTVGGTETNWESGTIIDLELPADEAPCADTLKAWKALTDLSLELTPDLLKHHSDRGELLDESKIIRTKQKGDADGAKNAKVDPPNGVVKPKLVIKPPSPLPKSIFGPKARLAPPKAPVAVIRMPSSGVPAEALVIQIIPHHNGEVFLSKIAINQNPDFFGFPFTGATTPKKAGNPAYPQRTPDPVVNLTVHGEKGKALVHLPRLALNTVFYENKSEIRITVPPEVVQNAPEYSILVMRHAAPEDEYDYDMDIYPPNNSQFASYLAICNQTLPSGGKPNPRKMGWL